MEYYQSVFQTMKKNYYFLFVLFLLASTAFAQIINPKETAKRKANDRVNNSIDRNIDKGLDKVEEGIGNIFKKKDKKAKKTEEEEETTANTKKKKTAYTEEAEDEAENEISGGNAASQSPAKGSMKAYSKFDFIPGEKVIAVEDFAQDAVGDFPAKWNTNASGEVVKIGGNTAKWLQFANKGIFYPEFINELPENFTVEYDMLASGIGQNQTGLQIVFPIITDRNPNFDQMFGSTTRIGVDIHPVDDGGTSGAWVRDKAEQEILSNEVSIAWKPNDINRISIWRQKTRLRVYLNETKIWDLPRAFFADVKYSMLFATYIFEGTTYLSNLRVAVGAPDTRNKLLTEGKLVTRGILFDVNSDKLKPESYGVLKEIGTVLKENPTLKVKIIGHTDSDGDDAKNLDLSKRRAAAVKTALTSEFGIAPTQMESDGKGEAEPSEPNTTPQGKANNRRVEFIKTIMVN